MQQQQLQVKETLVVRVFVTQQITLTLITLAAVVVLEAQASQEQTLTQLRPHVQMVAMEEQALFLEHCSTLVLAVVVLQLLLVQVAMVVLVVQVVATYGLTL
jgi:hypothetical protein